MEMSVSGCHLSHRHDTSVGLPAHSAFAPLILIGILTVIDRSIARLNKRSHSDVILHVNRTPRVSWKNPLSENCVEIYGDPLSLVSIWISDSVNIHSRWVIKTPIPQNCAGIRRKAFEKTKDIVACGSFLKPSTVNIQRRSSSVQHRTAFPVPSFLDLYV